MRQILFVDDEPRVLEGLQRMLRPRRHEWQMSFAEGGAAAIKELDGGAFDVLVCDMQMPGIDGLALLKYARDRHPQVARIILSGQTRPETMTQVAFIAHQFLSKPCNAADLVAVVERVCGLQSLLNNPTLQSIVGSIGNLPILPRVYRQLTAALEDPDSSLSTVVRIVEQDVVLSARCLQFANSAFFGLPHRVVTLDQAVAYLGIAMLRDLVISSAAFSAFSVTEALSHAELDRIENHGIRVARLAQMLLDNREASQQAFLAGMLHDLGYLILATHRPELSRAYAAADTGLVLRGTSDEFLARIHPSVGAYLLGLWGLPHSIIEAVAYHQSPEQIVAQQLDVSGAVYVAHELICDAEGDRAPTPHGVSSQLDQIVAAAGVADRLPRWRELARELASPGPE